MALINAEEVPWSAFETYLEEAGGQMALALSGEASSRLLDQFLDEELLHREAVARGLVTPEASRRTSAAALVEATIDRQPPPEPELRRWYREHRRDFERPSRVRLRQILTDRQDAAARAQEELAAGADFPAVAKRWSIDPSRDRGGDQSLLALRDLPASLARAVEDLEPGDISPIVETEYGFHIFQILERRPAGLLPYRQARADIEDRLLLGRRREALARLVAEARARYNVRVAGRNLPFSYTGDYPESQ
ncbi:MAG: peptidylprolyl isomerase [Thermoanaerobaculia bacterium]